MSWASNHPTVRRVTQSGPARATGPEKTPAEEARASALAAQEMLDSERQRYAGTASFSKQRHVAQSIKRYEAKVLYWEKQAAALEAQQGGDQ
ncbi:hypothetical protein ABFU65_12105 [Xanthomonas campestris pv. raphani]|uniref:hypothetical protein n=1 Tax=Xanthomonas campestris TaxID=339 RepID=UPI002B23561F|nr:hypothetical protein [Xanthomonas campestris]MEB1099667.1 hypothetical protein [Xanthomonas campestris pv. campestris]MEA9551713.1 hypothetical protein [Xanthomonas campestris]MEA9653060.1 hypothetical protein [Xanthomonas campestris pv. raphani]MEB1134246.1 hypothetical protein [Xanthomonas campestris pv. campestris]MEB1146713.1 hypothetical protein [Xanthomonas campestris pv. campestris]